MEAADRRGSPTPPPETPPPPPASPPPPHPPPPPLTRPPLPRAPRIPPPRRLRLYRSHLYRIRLRPGCILPRLHERTRNTQDRGRNRPAADRGCIGLLCGTCCRTWQPAWTSGRG